MVGHFLRVWGVGAVVEVDEHALRVGKVEAAVVTRCASSGIVWTNPYVSCLARHSVRLPSPRCLYFPPAGLIPPPVSWRMTCEVMAVGLAQGCAVVTPLPVEPVQPVPCCPPLFPPLKSACRCYRW